MYDVYALINDADQMTDPTKPNIQFIIGGGVVLVSGRPHSHVGRYTLQLENVTLAELTAAVQLLEENGIAKRVDIVYDYYGQPINTTAKIKLASPTGMVGKRGIGIELKKGKVVIVSDRYGMDGELKQIEATLADAVTTARLKKSMEMQRYRTSIKYKRKERSFVLVGMQA